MLRGSRVGRNRGSRISAAATATSQGGSSKDATEDNKQNGDRREGSRRGGKRKRNNRSQITNTGSCAATTAPLNGVSSSNPVELAPPEPKQI